MPISNDDDGQGKWTVEDDHTTACPVQGVQNYDYHNHKLSQGQRDP